MNKNKTVKKAVKRVPQKLAEEMAKEAAAMIKYIGLDCPSDTFYQSMDEILNSFENEKRAKDLRKKINQMSHREVVKLEEKVNDLLESGKYD